MRLRSTITAVAVAALALPAMAADPGDGTLYLRASEGGCADKVLTLQAEPGEGETTCNTRVGLPLYEVDQQAGLGLDGMDTFTTVKEVAGFSLDATTDLAGTLTFRHGGTPTDAGTDSIPIPAGGGYYEVDVEVTVNGKVAGSATYVLQTGSMDVVELPFELDLDDALNGVAVDRLAFSVGVGGVTPNSGWVKLDGASFINVPRA